MPAADSDLYGDEPIEELPPTRLPFPPVTKQHIIRCDYGYWYRKYSPWAYHSIIIRLTKPFVDYLLEDGIILPPDNIVRDDMPVANYDGSNDDEISGHGPTNNANIENQERAASSASLNLQMSSLGIADGQVSDGKSPSEDEYEFEDDETPDPSRKWRSIYYNIEDAIEKLGGTVTPKLNWSSPKDATFMNLTNTMECRTVNDILLLLQSSTFITHDLVHCFDGCVEEETTEGEDDEGDESEGENDEGDESEGEDEENSEGGEMVENGENVKEEGEDGLEKGKTIKEEGGTVTEEDEKIGEGEYDSMGSDEQSESEPYSNTDSEDLTPTKFCLVLRQWKQLHPAMEFRVFVRNEYILGISQRDTRCHYEFLFPMVPTLKAIIVHFFEKHIRDTFQMDNFAFDIYVEEPHHSDENIKLIDFNPWAPRTDTILFSWLELLTMPQPKYRVHKYFTSGPGNQGPLEVYTDEEENPEESDFVDRLRRKSGSDSPVSSGPGSSISDDDEDEEEDEEGEPEDPYGQIQFRLVEPTDQEAVNFSTPAYSAHKLPREVVDATQTDDAGAGMKDLLQQWREQQAEHEEAEHEQA